MLALDLVRLLAMVLMVQGHTLDVLLHPSYQAANWYSGWQFVRGFTAPTFLTLSGFAFALATVRRWDQHVSWSAALRRRVCRFAFFLCLGYAMHFPVHRLSDLRYLSADGWRAGLQVDVLQTIAVSLLLLQALVWLTRTPARFTAITLAASVAVAFATAFMWATPWAGHLPLGVAAYLNGATGSLFPLFPWSTYVLLGAGLGTWYAARDRISPRPFARRLLLAGTVLAISGSQLEALGLRLYEHLDFWHTSPTLFFLRAGVVLLALGVALHLKRLPAGTTIRALAQQSLVVYALHVCLLYGSIWNAGMRQHWGSSFGLARACAVAVVMIVFVMLVAFTWERRKAAMQLCAGALVRVALAVASRPHQPLGKMQPSARTAPSLSQALDSGWD